LKFSTTLPCRLRQYCLTVCVIVDSRLHVAAAVAGHRYRPFGCNPDELRGSVKRRI